MSAETRQMVEVLLALSPWAVFACLVVWSFVQELRDVRDSRTREGVRQREERAESRPKAA